MTFYDKASSVHDVSSCSVEGLDLCTPEKMAKRKAFAKQEPLCLSVIFLPSGAVACSLWGLALLPPC